MSIEMVEATLAATLGIPLETLGTGALALREFHKKFPNETVLDDENGTVTFGTEDMTFELSTDLNEDLDTVYKTTATTYCPKEVLFDSDWVFGIDEAIEALKVFLSEEAGEEGEEGIVDTSESSEDEEGEEEDDVAGSTEAKV